MTHPVVAPYGSWKSPIQARQIAEAMIGLGEPMFDGGRVWWFELRPTEGGRYVVVRRDPRRLRRRDDPQGLQRPHPRP